MLYIHATIITIDATRRIIADGAIHVDNGIIAAIDKTDILLEKYPHEQQYSLAGCIVIPGLISTHVHTVRTILRGTADIRNKETWLSERIWKLQSGMNKDDARVSGELTVAEMLKSGTTCFLECLFIPRHGYDELCKTVQNSGIRACLGRISLDGYSKSKENNLGDTKLSDTLTAWNKWNGAANDRIRVWIAAKHPNMVTEDWMRKLTAMSHSTGIRSTIHLAESRVDAEYISSLGHTPASYAKSVGLLTPSTVFAHTVHMDKASDIPMFAASGAHISHCPTSNAKLASGVCSLPDLLEAGVNVSLGTDGCACNNTCDMFLEMRLAALIHNTPDNPAPIRAETALEMATINGAKALGLENTIGSLEIGKRADFMAINTNKAPLQPCLDPVSNVVYATTGRDVHVVVVDGQLLVEQGKVLTMDEEAIVENANQAIRGLLQRIGLHDQVGSPWPIQ